MSTPAPQQARFRCLEQWAHAAAGAGFPVPSRPQLIGLAEAGGVSPMLSRVREIAMWRPTIEWLIERADEGAQHPLSQLPPALVRPQPNDGRAEPAVGRDRAPQRPEAPPPGPPEATREQRRLASLISWHKHALNAGVAGANDLREMHLRLVANSHVASAEEIRAIFPPVVGQFAGPLAEALGGGVPRPVADHERRGDGAHGGGSSHGAPNTPPRPGVGGAHGNARAGSPPPPPPSAEQRRPEPEPEPELSVDPSDFAPFEFGASDERPAPLRIRRRADGAIVLSWPEHDNAAESGAETDAAAKPAVVIDRLITSDEYPPYSPDAARVIVATRGTEAIDALEFGHAARHYQVWRNVGSSERDAKSSQPVKVASGELVSTVLDFDVREDEGRVIGQWRVLPGTTRVQVFRIPIHLAAGASGHPQFRILHDDANLGGFVDTQAERGARYLYQVFAEAEFDGVARLSSPTNHELHVSAIHEPVRDLSFELLETESDEEPLFDLSWTVPPGGQVVVYRTQQPPQPGIERQAIPAAALAQAGLPDARRQSHPIVTEGERASMRHVPWPRGWTRAYFTTVVMVADRAFVGNTVRGVRVPKVRRPKLIERVNRQILTFEWPEGADVVLAFSSMPGVESDVAMQGQPIEISRNDYRERGGLEFPSGRLDTKGCDLHLVSVAFDGGSRVLAAPEVVHYPGLLRVWYRLLTTALPDGRPLIRVQLRSEVDVEHAPPFVLVHHPDRLPLTIGDGHPVAVVPDAPPGTAAPQRRFVPSPLLSRGNAVSTWIVEPSMLARDVPPRGFLRLFVDLPPDVLSRVALLDPSVPTLRLLPPGPGPGMVGGPGVIAPGGGGPGAPRH